MKILIVSGYAAVMAMACLAGIPAQAADSDWVVVSPGYLDIRLAEPPPPVNLDTIAIEARAINIAPLLKREIVRTGPAVAMALPGVGTGTILGHALPPEVGKPPRSDGKILKI